MEFTTSILNLRLYLCYNAKKQNTYRPNRVWWQFPLAVELSKSTNQFAHAGGIMVVTPEGKLSRYFYGIDYAPKDLKFGIMDSAQSKIGNPAEQLYLYCFHYDPASGKYGLAILRVLRLMGIATILGLVGMYFVFWRYNKGKVADLK